MSNLECRNLRQSLAKIGSSTIESVVGQVSDCYRPTSKQSVIHRESEEIHRHFFDLN